jgi:hypothetical protein
MVYSFVFSFITAYLKRETLAGGQALPHKKIKIYLYISSMLENVFNHTTSFT